MSKENLNQDDIDALLSGNQPLSGGNDYDDSAETDNVDSYTVAKPLELSPIMPVKKDHVSHNIDLILDVSVEITAELGRKIMIIKDILEIGPGSIIELNRLAGEPVDLLVNNKLLARGEVVVINENFGVRIIDIVGPEQRIKNLR